MRDSLKLTEQNKNEGEDDDSPNLTAILGLEKLRKARGDHIHLVARVIHLIAQAVEQHVLLGDFFVDVLANLSETIHCHTQGLQRCVLRIV